MVDTLTSEVLSRAFDRMMRGEKPNPLPPGYEIPIEAIRRGARIAFEHYTQGKMGFIDKNAPYDSTVSTRVARIRREFSAANVDNVHGYLSVALTDDVGSQLKPG